MNNYKLIKRYDGLSEDVEIGEILLDVGNLFSEKGVEFTQLEIEEHTDCWENLSSLELKIDDKLLIDNEIYEVMYYNVFSPDVYLKSKLFKFAVMNYLVLNKLYLENKVDLI